MLIMDEVDGMAGNEDRGGIQVNDGIFFFTDCRDLNFYKLKVLD